MIGAWHRALARGDRRRASSARQRRQLWQWQWQWQSHRYRHRNRHRQRQRGRGPDPDRGSATIWVIVATAVLCLVFGAVLAMAQAVVARHEAGGAADLAALAAADHWMEGNAQACARADRVAAAQGARIVRCSVSGEVAEVTAAAGLGPFGARVRSRAGPAGPVAPGPPTEPGVPPVSALDIQGPEHWATGIPGRGPPLGAWDADRAGQQRLRALP